MNSATANSAKRDTSTAPLPRDNPACVQKSRLSGYTVCQNITVVSSFFFSKSCKNKHATLSALPSSCSINTFGQFFPKDPTICSVNKLCARRHNMSPPHSSPRGRPSASRAAEQTQRSSTFPRRIRSHADRCSRLTR